jgi:ABC-type multidrug transport system fused ATPase/permease subunit
MFRSNIKKILLIFFFVLIVVILFALYRYLDITSFSSKEIFYFIAILFSVFFLFLIALIETEHRSKKGKSRVKKAASKTEEPEENNEPVEKLSEVVDTLLKNLQSTTTAKAFGEILLKNFAEEFSIVRGIFYKKKLGSNHFEIAAAYAGYAIDYTKSLEEGVGITGQTALNKKPEYIQSIADGYIPVVSGLGSASASHLLILPFVKGNETVGIIELAAFEPFPENYAELWNKINKPLAEKIITL